MAGDIFTDTTDFYAIDYGDEIHVSGKRFKITGHAKELRFGIEDPKFWVKRAVDLDDGEKKFIKLSFFETFDTKLGDLTIHCFRNPEKEGQILNLTKNHPYFMQGEVYHDKKGNNIRVLDVVRGVNFLYYIFNFQVSYKTYFKKYLPGVLKELVHLLEAIRLLHDNGFNHGDIRNDHVFKEKKTGNLVWIDFDYDFKTNENPYSLDIFGLGNILCYAIGMGFHTYYNIKNRYMGYGDLVERIDADDFSVLDQRRLYNLRKLYPQIPRTLNNILLHFSKGADITYESVDEILEDLNRCLQAFD